MLQMAMALVESDADEQGPQGVLVADVPFTLDVTTEEATEDRLLHVLRIDLAAQALVEVLPRQGNQPLGVALQQQRARGGVVATEEVREVGL